MILNNTASTTTTVHNMTNSGWGKKRIQRAPLPGHHSEYKKLWHLTGRKLRPCTNWIDWKPDKGRSQENVQKCYSIKMILLNHCLFISIVVYIHIHVKGSQNPERGYIWHRNQSIFIGIRATRPPFFLISWKSEKLWNQVFPWNGVG